MTLTIHDNIEQGTDQWHDVRRGIITASAVGKLVTAKTIKPAENDYSRDLTRVLAAERITGFTEPTFISSDMWRGIDDEPIARAKYAEHYAPVVEAGFLTEDKWGFTIGYSPDGLVGDDGLIEIKCPSTATMIETLLTETVPGKYITQMQWQMACTGRAWCDFVCFDPRMPEGLQLYIKRVDRDDAYIADLASEIRKFLAEVEAKVSALQRLIK